MNIGETLAKARQDAGLTITQVSERTRVRETVIRAIERNDFTICGGNFYARGHIRGIARVVGVDAEPLVREYDDAHGGAPQAISAASAFEPEAPVMRYREHRSPNWTAAMAVALALVMVYVVVRVVSGAGGSHKVEPAANHFRGSAKAPAPPSAAPAQPAPSSSAPAPATSRKDVTLRVTATSASWIYVQDAKNHELFSGLINSGDSRQWTDAKKLKILIGNAGGVKLNVNGKDMGAPGGNGQVLRLSFGPGDPVGA